MVETWSCESLLPDTRSKVMDIFGKGVVLLKNSTMSLHEIADCFGEAYINDSTERFNISEDAKILRISNQLDKNNKTIGLFSDHDLEWHQDFAHTVGDYHGTAILGISNTHLAPTIFCDLKKAYDNLDDDLREVVEGVSCQHRVTDNVYRDVELTPAMKRLLKMKDYHIDGDYSHSYLKGEIPNRPLVTLHPITKEKSLYLGPATNLDKPEYFADLIKHCEKYEFSIDWEDGDIILFDNLTTMHRRPAFNGIRELHRIQFNYNKISI